MTAFSPLPAFPRQALDAITSGHDGHPLSPHARAMQRGAALHQAGLPEYALVEFGQALKLMPGDANAVSACAAVLAQMGRVQAAYRMLLEHRQALEMSAEGRCNLATGAAGVGELAAARGFYAGALALDAAHVRSLAGMSRLAALQGAWDEALVPAVQWAAQRPRDLEAHLHLADTLLQARRPSDALRAVAAGLTYLAGAPALLLRQGLAQACLGSWEAARQSLSRVDPATARSTFARHGLHVADDHSVQDVVALYIQYASLATQEAQWLYEKALPDVLRALLRAPQAASPLAWRSARAVAQSLALDDVEVAAIHALADASLVAGRTAPPAMPRPHSTKSGERLRIGLFVPRLNVPGATRWLVDQLAWHDTARFAIHLYAHTPHPEARWATPLLPLVAQLAEVAHMDDEELLERIRLDALDLLVDLSTDTADARPAVMAQHPATVLLRDGVHFPNHPPAPYDYALSDGFTCDRVTDASAGAIVRLPFSGSIAPRLSPPSVAVEQKEPAVFRFGADVPHNSLDPQTFDAWMQILAQSPAALLCLPAYPAAIQTRLRGHATRHRVDAKRLHFTGPDNMLVAGLTLDILPDVMLDPLRRSTPRAVACALAAGVPVVACVGEQTASRPGAAILRAAGMAETVTRDSAAYVQLAAELARSSVALAALRQRLAQARTASPWWDAVARTRERETAWVHMIESMRAGRSPAAFDVPPGNPTAGVQAAS